MWWIAVPWVLAAVRPFTRTLRFFVFLAVTSSAVFVSAFATPFVGVATQALVSVLWGLALTFPERLRLGALNADETRLDDSIGQVVRVAEEGLATADVETAMINPVLRYASLNEAASSDQRWRQVVTMLGAIEGPDRVKVDHPQAWILLAARHYWHDVRNRRVIGRRSLAGPWDYDLYLHVQLGRLMADGAEEDRRAIAGEIAASTPPDPGWERVRDLLVALTQDGESSVAPTGIQRNKHRRALDQAWQRAQETYRSNDMDGDLARRDG